jgi:hypothetical protein
MPSTISYTGGSITPTLVLGYEARRESRNIIHELLDSPDVAVTLRPAGRLTGTLVLFFTTQAAALAADAAHKVARVFTFADTDLPGLGMRYVTTNATTIALDDGRKRWTVSVPYQEIA